MTQTLFVYWQQLTQRREDDAERAEAPVLDLDSCFRAASLGDAGRHAPRVTRLAERGAVGTGLR